MTTFGNVAPSNTAAVFVESASPDDLASRANAAIATIAAQPNNRRITEINLAGAGDGYTFVIEIVSATLANVSGGLIPSTTQIGCYLAAQQDALTATRALAKASFNVGQLVDEQMAGASKGTRIMGALVVDPDSNVAPLNPPRGEIGSETTFTLDIVTQNVLAPLTDTSLVLGSSPIQFDSPAAGQLRYIGGVAIRAILAANVSMRDAGQNGPVVAKLAITRNNVQVGFASIFTADATAGGYNEGSVDCYTDVVPGDIFRIAVANTTNTDDLSIASAHLLAAEQ